MFFAAVDPITVDVVNGQKSINGFTTANTTPAVMIENLRPLSLVIPLESLTAAVEIFGIIGDAWLRMLQIIFPLVCGLSIYRRLRPRFMPNPLARLTLPAARPRFRV